MKYNKSKIIFIILLIAIPTILHQCKDKESEIDIYMFNPILKGRVIDELTKKPINEVNIKIGEEDPFDGFSGTIISTDTNGIYQSGRIDSWMFYSYIFKIEASKDKYETKSYGIQDISDYSEDTLFYDFSLMPRIGTFKVIPDTLNFRNDLSSLSIIILNTSTARLDWIIYNHNTWILLEDIHAGQIAVNEFVITEIKVDRSNLIPGNYSSTIEIGTNVGNTVVPVYVSVD